MPEDNDTINVRRLERNGEYREVKQELRDEWRIVAALMKQEETRVRRELQGKWRDRIWKRDGRCVVCGDDTKERMHLAHITSVGALVRAGRRISREKGERFDLRYWMSKSYRLDNLVILCSVCHRCQHGSIRAVYGLAIKEALALKDEMEKSKVTQGYNDLKRRINKMIQKSKKKAYGRRRDVESLFRELKKKRGWTSAEKLLASEEEPEIS